MHHQTTLAGSITLPPLFTATLRHAGNETAWVRASGELDFSVADELARTLEEGLAMASLVVLDLRGLTFLGTAGLHAIVDASEHARRTGRQLATIAGPPSVDRLIEVTETADQLDIVDPWAAA